MEWLIAMLVIFVLLALICSAAEVIENQKEQINKLHLECESYLQTLSKSDIIPATVVEDKIKQMNKKYGEVKLNIK